MSKVRYRTASLFRWRTATDRSGRKRRLRQGRHIVQGYDLQRIGQRTFELVPYFVAIRFSGRVDSLMTTSSKPWVFVDV